MIGAPPSGGAPRARRLWSDRGHLGVENGNALDSSWREWMPSLANTLRRCHSTVRGLRKSRAPISGFVNPSPASRAICRS